MLKNPRKDRRRWSTLKLNADRIVHTVIIWKFEQNNKDILICFECKMHIWPSIYSFSLIVYIDLCLYIVVFVCHKLSLISYYFWSKDELS
jgi:hypothetical protein